MIDDSGAELGRIITYKKVRSADILGRKRFDVVFSVSGCPDVFKSIAATAEDLPSEIMRAVCESERDFFFHKYGAEWGSHIRKFEDGEISPEELRLWNEIMNLWCRVDGR